MNFCSMKLMAKLNMVNGIPKVGPLDVVCKGCMLRKHD